MQAPDDFRTPMRTCPLSRNTQSEDGRSSPAAHWGSSVGTPVTRLTKVRRRMAVVGKPGSGRIVGFVELFQRPDQFHEDAIRILDQCEVASAPMEWASPQAAARCCP